MKKEQLSVYVNGKKVMIYRGMTVKHALIACDDSLYRAAKEGSVIVEDEHGFAVGLEGSLHEGAKLYIKKAKGIKG
jgi:hypothetical protein